MTVSVLELNRTERSEYACRLRDMARRVEGGEIAYATILTVNLDGKMDEFVLPYEDCVTGKKSK